MSEWIQRSKGVFLWSDALKALVLSARPEEGKMERRSDVGMTGDQAVDVQVQCLQREDYEAFCPVLWSPGPTAIAQGFLLLPWHRWARHRLASRLLTGTVVSRVSCIVGTEPRHHAGSPARTPCP